MSAPTENVGRAPDGTSVRWLLNALGWSALGASQFFGHGSNHFVLVGIGVGLCASSLILSATSLLAFWLWKAMRRESR